MFNVPVNICPDDECSFVIPSFFSINTVNSVCKLQWYKGFVSHSSTIDALGNHGFSGNWADSLDERVDQTYSKAWYTRSQ